MKKVTLVASGKFHFYDIAKILYKNNLLSCFYNNNKDLFKENKLKNYSKFDFFSFFVTLLIRFFNFNLIKFNHQNFPFNLKKDDNVLYVASLCLFKQIEYKEHNKKIIIDHGSPNLEYDKKIILREISRYSLDYENNLLSLVDNWVINQLNYEFENSSAIIVPSYFAKKTFLKKSYFDKIIINNILTNLNTVKKIKKHTKKFNVIYVGDFSLRKGVHRMILELCKIEKLQINLNLVGGNLEEHSLYHMLMSKIKSNENINVICHGKLSKQKLNQIYENVNLMIFPSLCDGYGIVVNEAISHGMPVVCSIFAGAKDIIKKYKIGYTYNPYLENNLLEKIHETSIEENYKILTNNILKFSNKIKELKINYENEIISNIK